MGEGRCANRNQAAPSAGVYRPRNPRASPLWQCARRHAKELREAGRLRRAIEQRVIERFLECGDPHHGHGLERSLSARGCVHRNLPDERQPHMIAVDPVAAFADGGLFVL